MKEKKFGTPHFFLLAAIRLNGDPAPHRRIPCKCAIGKNHWVKNPVFRGELS